MSRSTKLMLTTALMAAYLASSAPDRVAAMEPPKQQGPRPRETRTPKAIKKAAKKARQKGKA